jgi:hypothetical protein
LADARHRPRIRSWIRHESIVALISASVPMRAERILHFRISEGPMGPLISRTYYFDKHFSGAL